jgi:hypothetical protein
MFVVRDYYSLFYHEDDDRKFGGSGLRHNNMRWSFICIIIIYIIYFVSFYKSTSVFLSVKPTQAHNFYVHRTKKLIITYMNIYLFL